MEFYEDAPMPPIGGDVEEGDDNSLNVVEVFGIPLFDVPDNFDADALIVGIKGFFGDDEEPTLLFRASGNLADWEIRAILTEGLKGEM